LHLVVAVLKELVAEKWSPLVEQKKWPEGELASIFLEVVKQGRHTVISNPAYLSLFNLGDVTSCTAGEIWEHLLKGVQQTEVLPPTTSSAVHLILNQGNLSERLTRALGPEPTPEKIKEVYRELADCLEQGRLFSAHS
jgi:glutamate---cysteine ligase / carboxylate-amine ligase